ncbi:hypothetical protein ACH4UR_25195 [Streptomyces lydicus]|uniref:hypothetical protein n=1 Tax=Streptomyces lydicus TaxID=47763 RepID=UPI0033F1BD55
MDWDPGRGPARARGRRDATRAVASQQWTFVIQGSRTPGKATRTEVAFIPYVIA